MIRADVQIEADVLAAIADAALTSPKLMQTAFRRQTTRLRRRILDELQQDPGPVVYADNGHLRWKSLRQKRAVMAKLREENNLPYQRTGALLEAYDVEFLTDGSGGTFQVTNDAPHAEFVVGDDAQPFHLDTGWVQVADVVVKYDELATQALIETWWTVVSPFGGVPR